MASLIDRFTAFFRKNARAPQVTTASPPPRQLNAIADLFAVESNRRAVVAECAEMYATDPRPRRIISDLARDVTSEGVKVVVHNDARAQQVANDLLQRLDLESELDDFLRLAFRDGDLFLEPAVDGSALIQSISRKPTLQVRRNSDQTDTFTDPTRAYWQADDYWILPTPPKDAIWFADWQIIHARYGHDKGTRYGSPMFSAARTAYKRMSEGEYDIAVRRKTRAGQKFVHIVEGATEAELVDYQERNKSALENPFGAVTDFFTNKPGAIEALQGDARLSEIDDVKHHIETFFLSSPIPMALLGYGRDLNRDVLDEQKEQYDETLPEIRAWAISEIVKPLVELQWLLLGIYPPSLEYEIISAKEETLDAAALLQLATAVKEMRSAGFADEVIADVVSKIAPMIDASRLLPVAQIDATAPETAPDSSD